ncbi:MAG: hypothetical protein GWN00_33865, partial [Aliifodinibius sp.]|nr:hypothetical protein [Fodinibius sp.]NIV15742.1 hypothetical protein [Fodinibius sp.]NIY29595.1 hypothetical protein [Fodinibius sp.]
TAPVVAILNPVGGQVVRGTVNIVAEAHDDNEVDRVEFYIDGYLEETISDTPFDYLWDTANVGSGAHTIFVRAFDTNNNSSASPTITVTVDTSSNLPNNNIEPNVTIIAPDRNRVLFSESEIPAVPIKISIRNKSAIDRVELYIDGALQEVFSDNIEQTIGYEWNLKGYGDGLLHSIFVKAFDTPIHAKVD